ncbi:MAG TPA: DNA-3-methyladenine glycosylase, partial [Candidatus Saccharimonadia bacterium]|nr:DNA-3-methyladenine glycosylase [Candidatus Saccharimonadia bacterium]
MDELAPALLGTRLVRGWPDGGRSSGFIVEVEAYGGPEDRASHARSGRTARNATMWGPAGHAYVYRVYGLHLCLNIVAGAAGMVGAVLVRAVMPEGDDATLQARRARPDRAPVDAARLAS